MERQRVQLTPAYLLHQRPYGESGAIAEVFSREFGRVGLIARGVRSGRSRRQALLQPFGELLLSWQGRGELATLTAIEPAEDVRWLSGTALISAFYVNELLLRLLRRDDPHPQLYDDYAEVLRRLAGGVDEAFALRVFEKRLLEQLGYGLELEHDAAGEPIDPHGWYRVHPDAGPEPNADPRQGVPGAALLALAGESLDIVRYPRETRRVLQQALAPHLGERPLRSRELYRQFRRAAGGAEGKS